MPNPISFNTASPLGPFAPLRPKPPAEKPTAGEDFASSLKQQLQQANLLQTEADENVQKLLTGQSSSVTDVFVATRKAEVAFSLLMEIRNKLVDAYNELQEMRV